jgi:hypothetical protein
LAHDLLEEIRGVDERRRVVKKRLAKLVAASHTTVTDVYGVGPVVAAAVIGYVVDVRRFSSRDRFATYNATAPIERAVGLVHATGHALGEDWDALAAQEEPPNGEYPSPSGRSERVLENGYTQELAGDRGIRKTRTSPWSRCPNTPRRFSHRLHSALGLRIVPLGSRDAKQRRQHLGTIAITAHRRRSPTTDRTRITACNDDGRDRT